jgi:hypothetical protein
MANAEQEVMHLLTEDHVEGPSDLFGHEGDFASENEDTFDHLDSLDGIEGGEHDFYFAGETEADLSEDAIEDAIESEAEALIPALGAALGAESEDAFFGSLFNAIKKAAPIVGKIAKTAAPILQAIPIPAAQIAGQIAGAVGQMAGEAAEAGEGEDGVLQRAGEAAAEAAVVERRAKPVVVGIAARQLTKSRAAAASPAHRQQIVHQVNRVARDLTRAGGPAAIRALPKIAASVARTADARGASVSGRLQLLRRAVQRVASKPRLLRKLAQPTMRGQRLSRMMRGRPGMGRTGGFGPGYGAGQGLNGRSRRGGYVSGGWPGSGSYWWPGGGDWGGSDPDDYGQGGGYGYGLGGYGQGQGGYGLGGFGGSPVSGGPRRIVMREPCTITITPL